MAKNKTASLKQIFGIPTLNSLFQYILSNNPVRLSFFHVFLPNMEVTSSEPLNEHTRPVQDFQVLRHWLSNQQTKKRVKDLRKENQTIEVYTDEKTLLYNKGSTKLFTGFLQHFEEISRAFPTAEYDGSLDFICRLNTGERSL